MLGVFCSGLGLIWVISIQEYMTRLVRQICASQNLSEPFISICHRATNIEEKGQYNSGFDGFLFDL